MPGDEVIPAAPLHRIAGSRSRNPQAREAARYVSVRFASMLFRKLAGGFPSVAAAPDGYRASNFVHWFSQPIGRSLPSHILWMCSSARREWPRWHTEFAGPSFPPRRPNQAAQWPSRLLRRCRLSVPLQPLGSVGLLACHGLGRRDDVLQLGDLTSPGCTGCWNAVGYWQQAKPSPLTAQNADLRQHLCLPMRKFR
jgi:hypothetical protein